MGSPRYSRRTLVLISFFVWTAATTVATGEVLTLEVAQALSRFDERMKQSVVEIRLADVSKKAFAKFTGDHIGEKTEFRFQGKVLVNSVIREPIVGGTVQISGYFTAEEALAIVSGLSAGSMIEIATVPH